MNSSKRLKQNGKNSLDAQKFFDMILKAHEAHIINTSSVNGFWASVGAQAPTQNPDYDPKREWQEAGQAQKAAKKAGKA